MNSKKRLICALLILCYCAGCIFSPIAAGGADGNAESTQKAVGASSVTDFLDVSEDDWFYVYLDKLVRCGIINGKSKTEFAPDGTFSFAECSAVITRYLGLEAEAEERKKLLEDKVPSSGAKWYSGYLQLLHDLEIYNESMGLYTLDGDGFIIVTEDNANTPMKRYEFASAVAKSFQLDGSIRSKNIYSEVSGLGHDFIIGGGYNTSYFEKYASLIADFDTIPEEYSEDVLKLYYNGIFIGDTAGNFNPVNNIKRSEMAKVLATITDFSMRKCLINDYCPAIDEDKLFIDAVGVQSLDYKYCIDILNKSAAGFDASGDSVVYTPYSEIPFGYAVDVYLYSVSDTVCKNVLNCTLAQGDEISDGFTYDNDGSALRAILVLRNLQDNAKPEFTLNVSITSEGILTKPLISTI